MYFYINYIDYVLYLPKNQLVCPLREVMTTGGIVSYQKWKQCSPTPLLRFLDKNGRNLRVVTCLLLHARGSLLPATLSAQGSATDTTCAPFSSVRQRCYRVFACYYKIDRQCPDLPSYQTKTHEIQYINCLKSHLVVIEYNGMELRIRG